VQLDYATCSAGTSCVVPKRVWFLADQEMSWTVKVMNASTHKLVSGYMVCLVGRA